MGGKHLKKLRAEKSKVKFKKKTLPRGQNVTNTDFKVKKIVAGEQLKQVDENEPVSSWNIPLKDLLIRLNHYNYNSRLNGLAGVEELIKRHPDILKDSLLRSTVTRIMELLTDSEHKIRIKASGLLKMLFSLLPSTSIAPFHDILNVHLGCAMTHRDVSVQHDSLKFIDVIMEYAPEAVKQNFRIVIQNFTRILKSYKYGSHSEVFLLKGCRQDLEKSRTETLMRFYQILCIIYSLPEEEEEEEKAFNCKSANLSSKCEFSLRGLSSHYKKIPDMSQLFKKSRNEKSILIECDLAEFQTHCSAIMPVLFDTWAEFAPNRQADGFSNENILTVGISQLLLVILKILLLLYEKAVSMRDPQLETWFISSYGAAFKKSFMTNFPYYPSITAKKSNFASDGEVTSSDLSAYLMQNLILCYLSFCFKIKYRSNELELKIDRYVSNALFLKNLTGIEILSKVVEVIANSPRNKKSKVFISTIVKAHSVTNNVDLRRRLFKVLLNIALDENFNYQGYHPLMNWMKSLPDRFLKQRISLYVIKSVLKIISRPSGVDVLKELENKAVDIINNLPNIKVDGISQFEGQKLITHILYWCKNHVLEEILRKGILQRNSYSQELKSYMIDIFSYKLTGHSNFLE